MQAMSWLNKPWIHFVILGGVLYYLQVALFPEPKPIVGPISAERLASLEQQWISATGRPPSDEQLDRMVSFELDRDLLFQQALALELHLHDSVVYQRLIRNLRFLNLGEGLSEEEQYQQALELRLHLGDEVIKRRMVQVMQQLLLAYNPPPEPTSDELILEFEQRRSELRRPPRYSIEHIYFNASREDEATAAATTVFDLKLSPEQALELSSPFLPGYRFTSMSPAQLARQFGGEFVDNLLAADPTPGTWLGPIRSTYGLHLVYVNAVEAARDARLDEVLVQLQRDLEARAKTLALEESMVPLRERYELQR
ncbi:MAG: peptidyl-prolyl cis-trans isomerase [Pseudomonadota bacterium]